MTKTNRQIKREERQALKEQRRAQRCAAAYAQRCRSSHYTQLAQKDALRQEAVLRARHARAYSIEGVLATSTLVLASQLLKGK
jgi:hypothetical protein